MVALLNASTLEFVGEIEGNTTGPEDEESVRKGSFAGVPLLLLTSLGCRLSLRVSLGCSASGITVGELSMVFDSTCDHFDFDSQETETREMVKAPNAEMKVISSHTTALDFKE